MISLDLFGKARDIIFDGIRNDTDAIPPRVLLTITSPFLLRQKIYRLLLELSSLSGRT